MKASLQSCSLGAMMKMIQTLFLLIFGRKMMFALRQ